jgi:hypothetical protein
MRAAFPLLSDRDFSVCNPLTATPSGADQAAEKPGHG